MGTIILVNGYSFSLEDVVVVEEIQETHINGEVSKSFGVYLKGGYSLWITQQIKDTTKQNVIDLLYNAIYLRKSRIDTKDGVVDISTLNTSILYVQFKKP